MSLPPITIPSLDPAGPLDPDNDLLLIRQGLNDRKIIAGLLTNIRLGILDILPGQIVASDVLLIGRNNGSGYDNYIVPPQYLGFLNGTNAWFYQATAPLGWEILPGTGNRVLGCSDNSNKYNGQNAPSQTGTWTQPGHVLTVAEMPSHAHTFPVYTSDEKGNLFNKAGSTSRSSNLNVTTNATGGGQSHNHGSTWRPLANVGILCTKNKQIGQ